jgi:hypothetical protein
MSANGTKRTLRVALHMSAFRGKADIEAVCIFLCIELLSERVS